MDALPNPPAEGSAYFQKIADAFLGRDGLPFADLITADRTRRRSDRRECFYELGALS